MLTPAEQAHFDQFQQQTTEAIRRWGCMVQYVSNDLECPCCVAEGLNRAERRARRGDRRPSGRPMPAFAYTIGLHGVGHPEFLVFGVAPAAATSLLTRLAHEVRDHGHQFVPGEVIPAGLVHSRKILVESLPNPGRILVQANNYYRRPSQGSVEAVQLSWCDPRGRWPGDPGCTAPASNQPRPGALHA